MILFILMTPGEVYLRVFPLMQVYMLCKAGFNNYHFIYKYLYYLKNGNLDHTNFSKKIILKHLKFLKWSWYCIMKLSTE